MPADRPFLTHIPFWLCTERSVHSSHTLRLREGKPTCILTRGSGSRVWSGARGRLFLRAPPASHCATGKKQILLGQDPSSASGWAHRQLKHPKPWLGMNHGPAACLQRLLCLCSFLSMSKSLLGGCQEEPGLASAATFSSKALLPPRCRCSLRALAQHLAPSQL